MKLLNGLKKKGRPAVIPGSSRNELPQLMLDLGYKVGAEVGIYKGEFSKLFLDAGLQMNCIDPWMAFGGAGRSQQKQDRQDFLYGHTQRLLAPYLESGLCRIIRKTSMEALADFRDGSLDFVYIDGNHMFRWFAEDLYEWERKVRPGGVVSGHDYFNTPADARNVCCQVGAVVDAYTRAFGIDNWYIFGKLNLAAVPRNDQVHSWMWVKKQ